MLLLMMALRFVVSNVRSCGRGRGKLACRRCSRTAHGTISNRLAPSFVPQLTYTGHCNGVKGAREAAEADVVVLLWVYEAW